MTVGIDMPARASTKTKSVFMAAPINWLDVGRVLAARASTFTGIVFRTCSPDYANPSEICTGVGAARQGQRWNTAGLKAVYTALDESTSRAESGSRAPGIKISPAIRRLVLVSFDVTLTRVVHLDDSQLAAALPAPISQLLTESHRGRPPGSPPTLGQNLGHAAATAGIEGLIVPSAARPEGRCLIVFPDVASLGWYTLPLAGWGP